MYCFSDCDSFTIPFGDVAMDGTGYGSVAAVTCHSGYSLQGSPVVMCQSNGIWSRKPTCSIIGNFDPFGTVTSLYLFLLVHLYDCKHHHVNKSV